MDRRGPTTSTVLGGLAAAAPTAATTATTTAAAPTVPVMAQPPTSTMPIYNIGHHAVPSFHYGFAPQHTRGAAPVSYIPADQQIVPEQPVPSVKGGKKARLLRSVYSLPTHHQATGYYENPQTAIPTVSTTVLYLVGLQANNIPSGMRPVIARVW